MKFILVTEQFYSKGKFQNESTIIINKSFIKSAYARGDQKDSGSSLITSDGNTYLVKENFEDIKVMLL